MSNISGGTQRPRRSQQTRLTEKLTPETKPRQPASTIEFHGVSFMQSPFALQSSAHVSMSSMPMSNC